MTHYQLKDQPDTDQYDLPVTFAARLNATTICPAKSTSPLVLD
jgi:hypothetical protein